VASCVRVRVGVPEQWPHIRALYKRAGFAHNGHNEVVTWPWSMDLPRPAEIPVAGVSGAPGGRG